MVFDCSGSQTLFDEWFWIALAAKKLCAEMFLVVLATKLLNEGL